MEVPRSERRIRVPRSPAHTAGPDAEVRGEGHIWLLWDLATGPGSAWRAAPGRFAVVVCCRGVLRRPGDEHPARRPPDTPADAPSTSPAPSSATYADPRGDVWSTTGSDTYVAEATPAPGLVPTDVIRTRFRHLHSQVRLRMTFVDLQRPAPPQAPTKDGNINYYQVWVYAATSDGNGQYILMEISHNGAGKVTMHPFPGSGRTPLRDVPRHRLSRGLDSHQLSSDMSR